LSLATRVGYPMDTMMAPDQAEKSRARARIGLVVGPTGAGKTAFSIALAERLGAEIVNADSRQLYRGMDLGTAKPDAADRARVAHHLIDVCDPERPIDVAEFAAMARAAIAGIVARGRPVLVVGGSGLYLRVLRGGIFAGPPAAPAYRAELGALAAEHGAAYLHDRLCAADAAAARRISVNDLPRVIRALEVFAASGIPISEHQRGHRFACGGYESLAVGLAVTRARLYERIDRRFDSMIAAGLVEEVRGLVDRAGLADRVGEVRGLLDRAGHTDRVGEVGGLQAGADRTEHGGAVRDRVVGGARAEHAVWRTIGYRELAGYLAGTLDLPAAIARAKRESRRLAKRQMTWFRREPDLVWLDPDRDFEEALRRFSEFFHPS
jgi:tRNA dimethylallyltransferase